MSGLADAARDAYDLAFQVSPIFLTGGVASGVLGGTLPIIATLGDLAGSIQGLASGGANLQAFPIRFLPMPGTQAISQAIGQYPFATRYVAANATIELPRRIVYKMISPISMTGGYLTKLAIFSSLQSTLDNHNNSGGTYTIITPSLIFTDCVMLNMVDNAVSHHRGEAKQQQIEWMLVFEQPLISEQDTSAALSSLMGKISAGIKIDNPASWSQGIAGVIP